jgi:hypothetical protein
MCPQVGLLERVSRGVLRRVIMIDENTNYIRIINVIAVYSQQVS